MEKKADPRIDFSMEEKEKVFVRMKEKKKTRETYF